MDKNHLPRVDRLFHAIAKDPRKIKQLIVILDGLVELSLSGNIEGLGIQATAGRRFLSENLGDT